MRLENNTTRGLKHGPDERRIDMTTEQMNGLKEKYGNDIKIVPHIGNRERPNQWGIYFQGREIGTEMASLEYVVNRIKEETDRKYWVIFRLYSVRFMYSFDNFSRAVSACNCIRKVYGEETWVRLVNDSNGRPCMP